ncbi:MAG: isochorismatase [Clostridiaceae bacterium]|jgi:nicotinamidase-related amidase|nr:isochorismatase [Clostridiaceae bacterium]
MNKISDIKTFNDNATRTLTNIINSFEKLPTVNAKDFPVENTMIVVVDMVNGFAKKGALYSKRVEGIIPNIEQVLKKFKGYQKIFICEAHTEESREFNYYPEHCLVGTEESEIVEEFKPYIDEKSIIIKKNSTNGFLSKEYAEFFMNNSQYTNVIIMGDCTDICILQYALTQMAFYHEWNIPGGVYLPIKCTETYETEEINHNADLMNVFALYNMQLNGVQLIKDIS